MRSSMENPDFLAAVCCLLALLGLGSLWAEAVESLFDMETFSSCVTLLLLLLESSSSFSDLDEEGELIFDCRWEG